MAQHRLRNPHESCPECDIPQRARNHFFTGKMLVERDFTDEQRYHMGKDRRHNQRLHGWGVVCGLEVAQHPQEACRDRYVVIEPGTAVDCCGREILVECAEVLDFRQRFLELWQAGQEESGDPGAEEEEPTGSHRFQICLRYRECPTEDVPKLFDECGCDQEGCEPNRILEGFELDLVLDPEVEPRGPAGRDLEWRCTLNLAHAVAVAPHDASGRIYVLSGPASATLYQVSSSTQRVLSSRSLTDQEGLDVAVSADGEHVYVAVQQEGGAADPQVLVLVASDLAADPVHVLEVPLAAGSRVRLAAAPDGRLLATDSGGNRVLVWGSDVHDPGPPAAPQEIGGLSQPSDVALGGEAPGGGYAYVANATGGEVSAIRLSDLTDVTPIPMPVDFEPFFLAAAHNDLGDTLAVVDRPNRRLLLVAFRPDPDPQVAPEIVFLGDPLEDLAEPPVAVAISPGGGFVYVAEEQSGGDQLGFVQVVDAHRLESGEGEPLGEPRFVGERARDVVMGSDGSRLYVAYQGDPSPDSGGVAVLEALDEDCRLGLVPCPECSHEDQCLVLATVEDYEFGDQVVDPPPGEDEVAEGQAALDNLTDRRLLPSVQALAQVVRCLAGRGGGEPGEQGPPGVPGEDGQPGQDGAGIDDVTVTFVDCERRDEAGATLEDGTLELVIPSCCVEDLTHITAINWDHGRTHEISPQNPVESQFLVRVPENGIDVSALIVAFDGDVQFDDIHRLSFRVLWGFEGPENEAVETREGSDATGLRAGYAGSRICWCQLDGITAGILVELGEDDVAGSPRTVIRRVLDTIPRPGEAVNAASFVPTRRIQGSAGFEFVSFPDFGDFRVQLEGDLIRDVSHRAVDIDHMPPWLPLRTTGDGTPGGLFESWFAFRSRTINPVNVSTAGDLASRFGLSPTVAGNIVAHREEHGPFEDLDGLLEVAGVGRATLERLRSALSAAEPREGGTSSPFGILRGDS